MWRARGSTGRREKAKDDYREDENNYFGVEEEEEQWARDGDFVSWSDSEFPQVAR